MAHSRHNNGTMMAVQRRSTCHRELARTLPGECSGTAWELLGPETSSTLRVVACTRRCAWQARKNLFHWLACSP
eukprot:10438284-Lingulodinium_polyedra.AAC.1